MVVEGEIKASEIWGQATSLREKPTGTFGQRSTRIRLGVISAGEWVWMSCCREAIRGGPGGDKRRGGT